MKPPLVTVLCGAPTRQRGRVSACPAPLGHVEERLPGPVLISDRIEFELTGQAVSGSAQIRRALAAQARVGLVCRRHGPLAINLERLLKDAEDIHVRTHLVVA